MNFKAIVLSSALILAVSASADDFSKNFEDATLRVDYIAGEDGTERELVSKWDGWHGRRVNLDSVPYKRGLLVTMRDFGNGEVIYKTSACEAVNYHGNVGATANLSYNVSLRLPLPKRRTWIELTYFQPNLGKYQIHYSISDPKSLTWKVKDAKPAYKELRKIHSADTAYTSPVNIAILSEGYTENELDRFFATAKNLGDSILARKGFAEMSDRINLFAVGIPSDDSGITQSSKDIHRNTALRAEYDSRALDRLIVIPDLRKLGDAMECVPADHAIIIANSDIYGGSANYNSYSIGYSDGYWADKVLIHEFGHGFINLGDEYEDGYLINYPSSIEPEEPNITTLKDFSGKWQPLIDAGEASLIEGAGYMSKGVWRGCEKCIMRNVEDGEFCPVCTRAIKMMIEYLTEEGD